MITIDIVDSINEKINLFNDTYGTEVVAVFPEREEIYVREMGKFLKSYFEGFDDVEDVPVDIEHNLRTVERSVLTQDKRYQVFLQDEYTGYTVIGEYEIEDDAINTILDCTARQYNIRVAMNYELSVTVTASSLSEAEDAVYNFCCDSLNLENHYTYGDGIDEWDIDDSNIEIMDSELA